MTWGKSRAFTIEHHLQSKNHYKWNCWIPFNRKKKPTVISNGCGQAQGVSGLIVLTAELSKGSENSGAAPSRTQHIFRSWNCKDFPWVLRFNQRSFSLMLALILEPNTGKEDVPYHNQPLWCWRYIYYIHNIKYVIYNNGNVVMLFSLWDNWNYGGVVLPQYGTYVFV